MRKTASRLSAALAGLVLMGVMGTVTAPPAFAAGGTTQNTNGGAKPRVGQGAVVVSVCAAHAVPGPNEFAVATAVRCSINGYWSPTVTMPGGDAVVVHANATSWPVVVCVQSQAVFVPLVIGAPYTSEWRTTCWTFDS